MSAGTLPQLHEMSSAVEQSDIAISLPMAIEGVLMLTGIDPRKTALLWDLLAIDHG